MPTILYNPALLPLDPQLVARWRTVSTTITADLFKGRVLADRRIRPLRPLPNHIRLVGRAVTARCEDLDFGAVLHAVDRAERGDVLVIAAGGNLEAAMIGDLLSGKARLKGIAGVVCDGAVRDIAILKEWADFPVFTLGTIARGPSSKERGSVNEPVDFGGVRVTPGDLVVGDEDGLVFLSPGDAIEAIEAAEARVQAELGWMAQLQGGQSLGEVFAVPAAVPAPEG
jgi:4-hydroxy-4-methyl-2-oxoglutarate aldolase